MEVKQHKWGYPYFEAPDCLSKVLEPKVGDMVNCVCGNTTAEVIDIINGHAHTQDVCGTNQFLTIKSEFQLYLEKCRETIDIIIRKQITDHASCITFSVENYVLQKYFGNRIGFKVVHTIPEYNKIEFLKTLSKVTQRLIDGMEWDDCIVEATNCVVFPSEQQTRKSIADWASYYKHI